VIIGTAGHVDHGKTALVAALTGIAGDRLKEEKARGITIDLGFAYLPIDNDRTLGFIDVPGHERFVHTMLAGAGGIDFVLLVIAADDGIRPQTLEHLAIIDLLGIEHGAVALTKCDVVPPERVAAVADEIRSCLVGTVLEGADVLPVSAVTRQGIDELRTCLAGSAMNIRGRPTHRRFRLAVDRVFTLQGVGIIVTGTVLSGSVHVGDRVSISPRPFRTGAFTACAEPGCSGRASR
jgi:selenocysteine-specific elongation factor